MTPAERKLRRASRASADPRNRLRRLVIDGIRAAWRQKRVHTDPAVSVLLDALVARGLSTALEMYYDLLPTLGDRITVEDIRGFSSSFDVVRAANRDFDVVLWETEDNGEVTRRFMALTTANVDRSMGYTSYVCQPVMTRQGTVTYAEVLDSYGRCVLATPVNPGILVPPGEEIALRLSVFGAT